MTTLFLDLESFSECDLKTHGTPRYAAHPSTEIMLAQWAVNDGEPVVEEGLSDMLRELMADADVIVIHNSAFDRALIRNVWGIDLAPERIDDTMVRALAHGLPGALGKVGECLGVPLDEQKDKRGTRLIQLFCKPQPKGNKLRRATKHTHPAEWAEFVEYSRQDIPAMRAIHQRLPNWNYRVGSPEHALWCLDQRINDRGFAVDTDLARAALEVSAKAQTNLAEQVQDASNGEIEKASKRDQFLKHIVEHYGVELPDLKKDTLKRRLEDPDLPDGVKQLIAIRLEASMTSSGKYKALLNAVSTDGRLRNTLQFAGAARTRRWAGRIFQPQNMMRPTMKKADIALGIELIKARYPEVLFPDVMTLCGNAARGCIVAGKGKKLVVADLSNIEGRMLVELSGEQWKLKAFAEFDAGRGPDMYKLAYARSFGVNPADVESDSPERQIGKVQELGLGYGGGVAAFLTFAMVYNMDLDAMADAVWAGASPEQKTDSVGMWNWASKKNRTLGLTQHVYTACEILKQAWRDAHPCTEALWGKAGEAFRDATLHPGVVFEAGPLKFRRDKSWLRVRLPSGNYLCYLNPKVEGKDCTFMGLSPYTRQWRRQKTYGGKIIAEATQSSARDLLGYNMPHVEEGGYEIVLDIHDELLTEADADDDSKNAADLSARMTRRPHYLKTIPLAAAGFETFRYRKS